MNLNFNFSLAHCYQVEFEKLFDITSSLKSNSKSEKNNETKIESHMFHCCESGF